MIPQHYDRHAFDGRRPRMVSPATGISWDDAASMHVQNLSVPFSYRHSEIPEWALKDSALREVIVVFLEQRARCGILGSLSERLAHATETMRRRLPGLNDALDRLCCQYMTTEDPARKKKMQIEIQNMDTQVRVAQNPALLVAIPYLFFRVGLDSTDVASNLNLLPPHVRQVLFRMGQIAERLEKGTLPQPRTAKPQKPKQPRRRGVPLRVIVAGHLRANGWPWKKVAAFLGVSRPESLLTAVRKAGLYVKVPRQGTDRTPRRFNMNSVIAASLHNHGATWAFIAHLFGTQPSKARRGALRAERALNQILAR